MPELLAVDWGLHPEGIPEVFTLFKGPLVEASTVEVKLRVGQATDALVELPQSTLFLVNTETGSCSLLWLPVQGFLDLS
ncbi:hypothetical protein ACFZB6_25610 [Streptomyces syringium]|uniref:hypothetical protein n=1 Tax=Streptomyces syringium TaxID=76729 RepID=UPI00341A9CBE